MISLQSKFTWHSFYANYVNTFLCISVDVVIETPKGSKYKYKYDPETNRFKVHKLLSSGLAFPYDFGFIPDTKGDDGDPLDVMVFSEDSFLPGSVVECEIIGAIKAKQISEEETMRNDRIIALPALVIEKYKQQDLSKQKIKEIENFFVYYNKMEKKEFKPLGMLSAEETWKLVEEASCLK